MKIASGIVKKAAENEIIKLPTAKQHGIIKRFNA